MRVVLDTNIIISALLFAQGNAGAILKAWENRAFDLVVSPEILAEYEAALKDPQLRKRLKVSEEEITKLITEMEQVAVVVVPHVRLRVVKNDPDDNKFLECAVATNAAYIVSGDKELLILSHYQNIYILKPAFFVTVLKEESTEAA